jgi:hypothetical protein
MTLMIIQEFLISFNQKAQVETFAQHTEQGPYLDSYMQGQA